MKNYIISEDDLQSLVNYLGKKPYVEVHSGLTKLLNLAECKCLEEKTELAQELKEVK